MSAPAQNARPAAHGIATFARGSASKRAQISFSASGLTPGLGLSSCRADSFGRKPPHPSLRSALCTVHDRFSFRKDSASPSLASSPITHSDYGKSAIKRYGRRPCLSWFSCTARNFAPVARFYAAAAECRIGTTQKSARGRVAGRFGKAFDVSGNEPGCCS